MLREQFPDLFLVLVPRHFERCPIIGQKLRAAGVKFIYRNEIFPNTRRQPGELDCLLVNTTGELRFFYEPATLVFVGKSLTAIGGQNPIEPGALGKAMVFGPNMQNFADISRTFVKRDAAIEVKNPGELEAAFAALLADKPRRAALGRNALAVVGENRGALDRTADMIVERLTARGVRVAPKNNFQFPA
jgi:3-deoxy-D-manno-octulosonic-acid transferase